uniref:Kinesin-like protein KIF1C n=1 Tax=Lygus hesperus TaxID=30085 RepID=A0A0A9Z6J0_LYGHE
MKSVFARTSNSSYSDSSNSRELSVSVCLIQDDVVMDLLADEPRSFVTLVVAESPLFGNVVNGAQYLYMNNAADFNETLDSALELAEHVQTQNLNSTTSAITGDRQLIYANKGEDGILVVICVLKQIRRNQNGEKDVIVSSLFVSGVGDGIPHYSRILDKHPA